jgi:hypothetical protein
VVEKMKFFSFAATPSNEMLAFLPVFARRLGDRAFVAPRSHNARAGFRATQTVRACHMTD